MNTKTLFGLFSTIFMVAACSGFNPELSIEPSLVQREFYAIIDSQSETKTSLDSDYKVLWDESGEAISVVDATGTGYELKQKSVSADRKSAVFSGDVPASDCIYAVYPVQDDIAIESGLLAVNLPSEQNACAGSFDTSTNLAVSWMGSGNALTFKNVCGLIGFSINASGVTSIRLSATETGGGAMSGSADVDYVGDVPTCITSKESGLDYVELHGEIKSGTRYYMVVYPGVYSNLELTVTDNKGRSAVLKKDSQLVVTRSGVVNVSEISIADSDWTGGDVPGGDGSFSLVTDASELKNGDEVLIVYSAGSKALGALNSSGNYRDPVDVGISEDKIASPGSATVLTLEAGSTSGTWAFKDGDNYLASAASGNYLKTSDTITENASWSVSISGGGLATIKAQAGGSIYISYNLSSPRFTCYKNTEQKAVSIYRRESAGGGSNPSTPLVTTLQATNIGTAEATLNASFSNIPINPNPVAAFFRWGTSASSLTNEAYDNGIILNTASGTFSAVIASLEEATSYYYQAVITLADGSDVEGSVMKFSTRSSSVSSSLGYLDCYEVPAFDLSGTMTSGNETSGRGYKWYRYDTSNSMRKVVTHTYNDSGRQMRNMTVMVDGNRKAPLWTSFVMHTGVFPDKNLGRGSWTNDPAIPESWQNSETLGNYHKGHLVASNYRQNYASTRNQTFYYTNQAPQYQTQFNDGIWNNMEQRIASVAPSGRDTLYLTVGVLYEGTVQTISGVPIPSHFYTCLMKCSFDASGAMTAATGCAYLFENRPYVNKESYQSYKFTIDEVEARAGFDFYHNVPDEFEDAAESEKGNIL